jgi:hypothetical protein
MSKMNELSIESQEEAYSQYVESLKDETRWEGRYELLSELKDSLESAKKRYAGTELTAGLQYALEIVSRVHA